MARLSLEEERDTLSAQCVRSRTKVVELQGLYQNAKEGGVLCTENGDDWYDILIWGWGGALELHVHVFIVPLIIVHSCTGLYLHIHVCVHVCLHVRLHVQCNVHEHCVYRVGEDCCESRSPKQKPNGIYVHVELYAYMYMYMYMYQCLKKKKTFIYFFSCLGKLKAAVLCMLDIYVHMYTSFCTCPHCTCTYTCTCIFNTAQ